MLLYLFVPQYISFYSCLSMKTGPNCWWAMLCQAASAAAHQILSAVLHSDALWLSRGSAGRAGSARGCSFWGWQGGDSPTPSSEASCVAVFFLLLWLPTGCTKMLGRGVCYCLWFSVSLRWGWSWGPNNKNACSLTGICCYQVIVLPNGLLYVHFHCLHLWNVCAPAF